MNIDGYMTRTDVAKFVGVKPDSLSRSNLPPPNLVVWRSRLWTREVIEEWAAARPGIGGRWPDPDGTRYKRRT